MSCVRYTPNPAPSSPGGTQHIIHIAIIAVCVVQVGKTVNVVMRLTVHEVVVDAQVAHGNGVVTDDKRCVPGDEAIRVETAKRSSVWRTSSKPTEGAEAVFQSFAAPRSLLPTLCPLPSDPCPLPSDP
ncbi:MAG: hypothetical protein BroJett007_30710 [Chloroflexota bacterium]|nr:MAG: hypothetical protein BroJett007_30710 [Chloroflexota bacterium]